jgi:hypothetical protein
MTKSVAEALCNVKNLKDTEKKEEIAAVAHSPISLAFISLPCKISPPAQARQKFQSRLEPACSDADVDAYLTLYKSIPTPDQDERLATIASPIKRRRRDINADTFPTGTV